MFNTPYTQDPFQMDPLQFNANGAAFQPGTNVGYVDTATDKGNQFGWKDPRTQGALTRDVLRYQNGQTMAGMNMGFNGMGNQMAEGFGGIGQQVSDGFGSLADMAQYGGQWGNTQNRNYAPQSGNNGSPFMMGAF